MTIRAPKPRVAVVVLNWNGGAAVLDCLESVRWSDYTEFVTILADNGSRDGSPALAFSWATARRAGGEPRPLRPVRPCPGGGRRRGGRGGSPVRDARGRTVGPDRHRRQPGVRGRQQRRAQVRSRPRLPVRHAAQQRRRGAACSAGSAGRVRGAAPSSGPALPRRLSPRPTRGGSCTPGARSDCGRPGRASRAEPARRPRWRGVRPTRHMSGCCALYRADFLRDAGLLDEEFFGHEDVALSLMAARRGLTFGVNLDVKAGTPRGGVSATRRRARRTTTTSTACCW